MSPREHASRVYLLRNVLGHSPPLAGDRFSRKWVALTHTHWFCNSPAAEHSADRRGIVSRSRKSGTKTSSRRYGGWQKKTMVKYTTGNLAPTTGTIIRDRRICIWKKTNRSWFVEKGDKFCARGPPGLVYAVVAYVTHSVFTTQSGYRIRQSFCDWPSRAASTYL